MSKKKLFIGLTVIGIVFALAFLGGYLMIDQHTHRPMNKTDETPTYIEIVIEEGMLSQNVTQILADNGLIRSHFTADWIVRLNNWGRIQAGTYAVGDHMSLADMFALFRDGHVVEEEMIRVTIPEGETLNFIANAFASALSLPAEELLDLWSNTSFLNQLIDDYWFITDEILNPQLYFPLEGYFYPITYFIPSSVTSPEVLTRILLDMTDARVNEFRGEIEASPYTFHQLLTFGAIIEAETQDRDEMANVAGVFQNRLDIDMMLQTDATIQYASAERSFHVTGAMLEINSPFNTYRYTGLPPGPVNSPSRYAVMAVLNPTVHEYLFFISDMFGCVGEPGNKNYFTNFPDHYAFYRDYLRPSYDAGYSVCNPNVQVN